MENTSCEEKLTLFPTISEADVLYSTYVANCVFNNFLCYTAIILNIVTIHAIRRTTSLPKTLKTLLLSLAISDVGVGLFTQTLYTSLLAKWLQQSIPSCSTFKVFLTLAGVFSLASFFSVVVVSVDRFLAIHLHLRYQELVTYKRVVAVVISIWMFSVSLPLISLWVSQAVRMLYICILVVVGIVLTTVAYTRIYLAVRRHKNQMEALQVQQVEQNGEMANFASLTKSAIGVFYVYLVFLLCYLPFFISLAAIKISGPSTALKRLFLFSFTLVYLNSTLNPVIYCWKMRHIRHAIMDIVRDMSWYKNCTSN